MSRITRRHSLKAEDERDAINLKVQLELIAHIKRSLEDEIQAIQRYLKAYVLRYPHDTVLLHEVLLILSHLDRRIVRLTELQSALTGDEAVNVPHDPNWRAIRLLQQSLALDASDVFDWPVASPYKELEDIYG